MVRMGYLALVGSLPKDGVSIKILVVVQPQIHYPYLMSAMSKQIYSNKVNGVGIENIEGLASGRGPVCERADPSGPSDTVNPEQNNQNSTTTRKRRNRKWFKKENMFIMECYFRSNLSRIGY